MEALSLLRIDRLHAGEVRQLASLNAGAITRRIDQQVRVLQQLEGVRKMEQLQRAIEEVKQRLSQIDTELAETGVAIDPLDSKAAMQAVIKKSKLTQEREALLFRQPALEKALKEAERTVASDRLADISTEMAVLAREGSTEAERFSTLLGELTRLVHTAGERRQRYHTLLDEARFHAFCFELDTPSFPSLATPSADDLSTFATQAHDALTVSVSSEWTYRLSNLRAQRMEETAKSAPRPQLKVEGQTRLPESVALARLEEERARKQKENILDRWYPEGAEHGGVRVEGQGVRVLKDFPAPQPNKMKELLED